MHTVNSRLLNSRKLTSVMLITAMLLFLLAVFYANPAHADKFTIAPPADTLTIKVGTAPAGPNNNPNPTDFYDYQKPITYTRAELIAMADYYETYSYFDSMPIAVLDCAIGISLEDLLNNAGIDINDVVRIYFYTTDMIDKDTKIGIPYRGFDRKYLFETPRYYYPNIMDSSFEYNENTKKTELVFPKTPGYDPLAGKVAVRTMLAVTDDWRRAQLKAEGLPSFATQDDTVRFRLLTGQTEEDYLAGTPTAPTSAKWVYEICVQVEAEATMKGDTNGDGIINSQDLLLLVQAIVNDVNVDKNIYDLNGDGIINSQDLLLLVQAIVN